jgi:hypothetical protein
MTSVTISQALVTAQVQVTGGPSIAVEIAAPPVVQVAVQGQQGPTQVFVQMSRPTAVGPWIWWQTDEAGALVDLTVNDGGI